MLISSENLTRYVIIVHQLLQKEPGRRLGSGLTGSDEIKRHKWFKPINWKKLEGREIQPSFRPEVAGKQCIANFEKRWTDMPLLDSPAATPKDSVNPFVDFSYVRPTSIFQPSKSPLGQHVYVSLLAILLEDDCSSFSYWQFASMVVLSYINSICSANYSTIVIQRRVWLFA